MSEYDEPRHIPSAILGAVIGATIGFLVCREFGKDIHPEEYDTLNKVVLYVIAAVTFAIPMAGGILGGLDDGAWGAVRWSFTCFFLYALVMVVLSIIYEVLSIVDFHPEALLGLAGVPIVLLIFIVTQL